MFPHMVPVHGGPAGCGERRSGPLLRNLSKLRITGLTKMNPPPFATLLGEGASARETLNT